MKIRVQWKDPDFQVKNPETGEWGFIEKLPEELQGQLRRAGVGEYLQVELNLDMLPPACSIVKKKGK